MDNNFRDRLSFSGSNNTSVQRENWREAIALLPNDSTLKAPDPHVAQFSITMPSIIAESHDALPHLEWWLADDHHSTSISLMPYFVDGMTTYRIPSFSHLLSNVKLSSFDHALVDFFSEYFCHDDAKVTLESGSLVNEILWTLAKLKSLRLASDAKIIQLGQPLQLHARLSYSEEWQLWVLNAELITQTGVVIIPEHVDFITLSGLVIHDGTLFPLPKGAAWVSQLLASGSLFIAKEYLGEALYKLAHRIQDGDFLRNLSAVHFVQKKPLPVVYLRAKQFYKQEKVTLYLAYRYDNCEVFSIYHSQEDINIPIGFASNTDDCVLYFRDLKSESEAELLIQQEANIIFVANKRAWTVNLSNLWQLIHDLLKKSWEVWAEKHKIEELSSYAVNLESGIGWFELQSFDTQTKRLIDPLQLIKYLKRKALFIQLGNNKICVLPERWIRHLTQFLDIGGQPGEHEAWRFSSIYAPEVDSIIGEELQFTADTAFHATVEKMRSFAKVIPLEQPEGLRAILRPYQLEGLTWLNLLCEVHVGGILADDMGLGKTVQILALLQHRLVNQAHLAPQTVLVVCPKSVQHHWLEQVKNIIPRLACRILNSRAILAKEVSTTQHLLLIVSYGFIRHHITELASWKFDLLILDEAQMIKNEFSQTSQAIKQLSATQRFALTGTPIENRFEELVSIFSFLNPHAPLSLPQSSSTAEALSDLMQRALHPFVLRRLKEDVLPDLPVKNVEKIILAMLPDQSRLYQELLEVYRNEIEKYQVSQDLPTESEQAFFLEGLLRLRQVATYPQQLLGEKFQNCDSNKLNYLCKKIPSLVAKGHRIVIFSQFLGALRGLSDAMQELNISYCYVDGETTDREREMFLFQSNTNIKLLLISLRVGGVGINLTHADVCILIDPWWNEAIEKQAIDRLHRFGQKKNVTVLQLISENSIEEKMEILKQNKSALVDAIGKTNQDFLTNLKWDDFTEIFK
jgi:SNF2 family DNA or RNA helicase